jgi:hypothetical protein
MFNYNVSNSTNNYLFETTTPLDQFEIRDYIMIDAPILGNAHLSLNNGIIYNYSFFYNSNKFWYC